MLLRDCDFRVYRVVYRYDSQIRSNPVGMDSGDFLGWEEKKGEAIIVAPNEMIARALFHTDNPLSSSPGTSCREILFFDMIHKVTCMMRG